METVVFFDISIFWGVCIFALILLISVIVLFVKITKYKDTHKKIIRAYNCYIRDNHVEIPNDKVIKKYVIDIILTEKEQNISNRIDELNY